MAYEAQKGQKWVAIVDGQEGAEYDKVLRLTFCPEGKMEYLAVKQNDLFRVRHTF